jgi:hypothetical protein
MGAKCELAELNPGLKFSKKLVNKALAFRVWIKMKGVNRILARPKRLISLICCFFSQQNLKYAFICIKCDSYHI